MILTRRFFAALLLAVTASGAAAAQQNPQPPQPHIHPLLAPLVENPAAEIHPIVSNLGGVRQSQQGPRTIELFLRTSASRETLAGLGLQVRTLRGGRATVTAPVSALPALAARPDVQLITLPTRVYPHLDKSVPETGVTWLRSESGGSFSGQTGAGVVVGVVDSGIDYDHPDFLDAAGNNRILSIWDQQASSGTAPSGYTYGNECTSADISAGTCSVVDEVANAGHGTHVTGIAAGTGAAPDASGATYETTGTAPGASIILVKTAWQSNHIIDGMNYIFDQAAALGLPAVVNLSLGNQMGAHDGNNPMEQEIDALVAANAGRAVVVSAGNEAGQSIHAEIDAMDGFSVIGPEFTVPLYTRAGDAGNDIIKIAGYYPSTDDLTVHLWSPNGEYYTRDLSSAAGTWGCLHETSGADGAVVLCNKTSSVLGDGTGDREIFVMIYDYDEADPPARGTWRFALTGNTVAGAGEVDFWMESSLGNSGKVSAFSTHVDETETLGIPATAAGAITVGAYNTRVCWHDWDGTLATPAVGTLGDIASFSGHGPTRDGRSKPDLAAPGMGIVSSLAQEVRSGLLGSGYVIDDHHLLLGGTSQAAPHVTGAVALLLEDDPTLTAASIKSLLRADAREDDWTASHATGSFGLTANHVFGAGKLDLGPWAWVDPYETNDTLRTAHDVVSGQSLDGYIEHSADVDLFHLEGLASGDTVNVSLTSLPEDYALTALRSVTLLLPCSEPTLASTSSSDNAGTANESLSYTTSLVSSPSYLRVQSSAGAVSSTDPYSLKAVITRPETTSAHGSTATAQALPEHNEFKVSGSAASVFETDYYSLTARSGQTITATAGLFRWARIHDSTGAVVATGGMGLGAASYTTPLVPLGITRTYYVSVYNSAGSYTLTTTVN